MYKINLVKSVVFKVKENLSSSKWMEWSLIIVCEGELSPMQYAMHWRLVICLLKKKTNQKREKVDTSETSAKVLFMSLQFLNSVSHQHFS